MNVKSEFLHEAEEFAIALMDICGQEIVQRGPVGVTFMWTVLELLIQSYKCKRLETGDPDCMIVPPLEAMNAEYVLHIVNRAMNDKDSREFGKLSMPFGQHKGRRIDDIPLTYLQWMTKNGSLSQERISAYLRSDRIRKERAEEPNRRRGEYCDEEYAGPSK